MSRAQMRSWSVAAAAGRASARGARPGGDPAELLAARLVAGILDLLLVAVIVFAAFALAGSAPLPALTKITLAVGFVLLSVLRRLVQVGHVRVAGVALCVVGWLAVATDLPVHGHQTVAVGGFVVLVVIGGLAVGPAAAVALAAATVVLMALVLLDVVPTVPVPIAGGAVRLTHYATQMTLSAALVAWWASHMRQLLLQLRTSEARHMQLLEASPDAIVGVDGTGTLTFCNSAVERILGYPPHELVGRRWHELPLIPERYLAELRTRHASSLAGADVASTEIEVIHRDGHFVTMDTKGYPIRVDDGRVAGVVAILRDVSERKKSEAERLLLREQLVTAQRMEAVGRFAGGIAHDFNNILTVILNATEVVGRGAPKDDAEALSDVRDAAMRGAALTRQLLSLGRRQSREVQATDLNRAASALRPMLERLLGQDVKIGMELDPAAPSVVIDPAQLDQVLVNLAVNARDAMPQGGTITFSTRALAAEGNHAARVALDISDDGTGMDEETRAHVFEPFFTTKGERGTGLGLAVVQNIVQGAGGSITCESHPGAGTRFRIELPAAPVAAETPLTAAG